MNDEAKALLPLQPTTFHILLSLADEDRHGYAIILEVARRTQGELRLSVGTLYRSIQRMLETGLIAETRTRPAPEMDDERRRYYHITPLGKAAAEAEVSIVFPGMVLMIACLIVVIAPIILPAIMALF